jgi:hypothetical protein
VRNDLVVESESMIELPLCPLLTNPPVLDFGTNYFVQPRTMDFIQKVLEIQRSIRRVLLSFGHSVKNLLFCVLAKADRQLNDSPVYPSWLS